METLLWILFIFVMIYYGLKLFVRYLLPFLLTRFIKNQQEKFMNMNHQQPVQDDLNVKTKKDKKSKTRKDDQTFGEYIDFEEIDDKVNS